ncbi:mate family transporter [Pseudohyphozyma bogoriensis]|nr:mate family transporter [Pseudohyphozyma bogoriensis]
MHDPEVAQDERTALLPTNDKAPPILKELVYIAGKALPIAASYTLQSSLQTFSIFVAGRLGPAELNAASQAYMFAAATGWVLAMGGTSALDTLGSSTFGSAQALAKEASEAGGEEPKAVQERREDLGVVLQRAVLILGLIFVPFAALWWWSAPVFRRLGQTEQLAQDVQSLLRVLILGAPGYIGFEAVKKFLQVQGIVHASTMVLALTSPLCFILNFILVHRTPLGVLGAPLATGISYWVSLGLLCCYCYFVRGKQYWGGWSKKSLTQWPTFLKLALPGIAMVGSEWWAFEIVALAAGGLGDLPLGAQSVIGTADQIICTLPLGIGVAVSNRVGALLGAALPRHARIGALAGVLLATIVGLILFVSIMASRESFGYLFSNDREVVDLVATVLPLVAAFQVFDGWAQSCSGILRGLGKQRIGASVNLVAYYVLALPAGIWLAYNTSLGLGGLWLGNAGALGLVGVGEFVLVWRTKWDREVVHARERTRSE